jgi:hypothetical protein
MDKVFKAFQAIFYKAADAAAQKKPAAPSAAGFIPT